jgi:hypothetical protein
MVRAGVQEVVCVIMWFVRFRVVRMAVMVLFGVRRVRSGCGFRCIGRVTFRCGRRCSVPRGFSVSGVRVGCWFRVCRFVFLIRGGGSSSGCFVGCGSSFLGCCSVGFPSGGSPKAGGACSPEPPAMRISTAMRVTTPITRRATTSPVCRSQRTRISFRHAGYAH